MRECGCYEYCIEADDIDFTGKATYTAVIDYILNAAGKDADINGFGVTDLNNDNCSWVISRMSVEFVRRMDQYDKFSIRTWVNEVSRVMTTRNMVLNDPNGNMVAAAVTQWAVLDLEKRIALDIRAHVDYGTALIDEPSPIESPRRIARVKPAEIMNHKVVYSDLDFNNHVNSMKYIEMMFDMLPLDWIADRVIRRLDINFLHEARYGESLTIGYEQEERSLFEITKENGLTVCKVALSWD